MLRSRPFEGENSAYQLEPKIVKSHYATTGGTTKDYAAALLAKLPEMNAKMRKRPILTVCTVS